VFGRTRVEVRGERRVKVRETRRCGRAKLKSMRVSKYKIISAILSPQATLALPLRGFKFPLSYRPVETTPTAIISVLDQNKSKCLRSHSLGCCVAGHRKSGLSHKRLLFYQPNLQGDLHQFRHLYRSPKAHKRPFRLLSQKKLHYHLRSGLNMLPHLLRKSKPPPTGFSEPPMKYFCTKDRETSLFSLAQRFPAAVFSTGSLP
jgi:hypothetical protein